MKSKITKLSSKFEIIEMPSPIDSDRKSSDNGQEAWIRRFWPI